MTFPFSDLPGRAVAWISVLLATATVWTTWAALHGDWLQTRPSAGFVLACVGLAAMEWSMRTLTHTVGEPDPWVLLGPLVLWLLGTPLALVAGLLSVIGHQVLGRQPVHKWLFNLSLRTVALLSAAAVMEALQGSRLPESPAAIETAQGVFTMVAGTAVLWLVPYVGVSVVIALSSQQSVTRELLDDAGLDFGQALLFAPVGPVILLVGARQPLLLPLLALPVVGALWSGSRSHQHQHQARTDVLTGLPNRMGLYEALDGAVREADVRGRSVGLCMIDLNDFKRINDTFGHAVGDEVLRHVGYRLAALAGPSCVAGRLGGDEFLLLWRDPVSRDQYVDRVHQLEIHLQEPMATSVGPLALGGSTGVAVYPFDGEDGSALLHHADTGMYRSKAIAKPPHGTDARRSA